MSDPARSHSEAQARASAWLAAWDQLGIHRTATVGGRAGAAWLAREATAFGVEVTIVATAMGMLNKINDALRVPLESEFEELVS